MSLPTPRTTNAPMGIDPKQLAQLEGPLIALTNQCGGDMRKLLFAFFSFLHRRTDFYIVPHDDDVASGAKTMGFKEGDAEKLLIAAFRQFPLRRAPSRQAAIAKKQAAAANAKSPAQSSPSATKTTTKEVTKKMEDMSTSKSTKPTDGSNTDASTSNEEIGNMTDVRRTEEGLQIPVGNGGSTPRYKWTQTIDECSVLIGVPKSFKGKDLDIKITSTSISVKSKKPIVGGTPHVFAEGQLVEKIRADESTWSLEGGVAILTLDKLKKTFWNTIIDGDDKIDTDLVDSRRHISEYDEATQGQLRKIIFDENQLRRGLKTSDELLGKEGASPSGIPLLPTGVEYINQQKVDEGLKK